MKDETNSAMKKDLDTTTNDSKAVLVTGPHCGQESDGNGCGVISIESESLRVVDLPPQKTTPKTPSSLSSFFTVRRQPQEQDEYKRMQELQDSEALTHIIPDRKATLGAEPAGFDVCKEYGYKYAYSSDHDDDDDDSDDEDQEEQHDATRAKQNSQPPTMLDDLSKVVNTMLLDKENPEEIDYVIYLLGKHYHPIQDYRTRRVDETSLLWFTYRCDFPEIVPYRITTDAGWGCMLRSAQMMLAQTLRMHFASREWKPFSALAQRRRDPLMRMMLTWFADFPSKTECVFSLHNMVATGMAKHDKLPGEWYGPGTACHVLRDLCHRYMATQKQQQQQQQQQRSLFRVHVADSQGTVYRDAVTELMRGKPKEEVPPKAPTHPLDPLLDTNDESSAPQTPWDTGLLLLIPLRLGLKQFQIEYSEPLAHAFSLPQSVGVLGGRPRGARWFYGATSDGNKLYGLDPHTIQLSPTMRVAKTARGKPIKVVGMTDEYLRSVHTTNPECVALSRLDPSLALGFYCRDANDFEAVLAAFEKRKKEFPDQPALVAIADQVPDYSANESMMLSMMSTGDGEGHDGTIMDDEDDFVML